MPSKSSNGSSRRASPTGTSRIFYFDPLKFPGFGKLYGLDMSRWPKKKRHFGKRHLPGHPVEHGDFILWHGEREGDTVTGRHAIGRGSRHGMSRTRGWSFPSSAMPSISIRGGIDNLYRHHDYNLAIVESLTGRYARYWMHGGHLILDGKKMSKSRGNIVYLSDLTSRGCTPEEVRFFLTYNHYRDRLNMTGRNQRSKERPPGFKTMITGISGGRGNFLENPGIRPSPAPSKRDSGNGWMMIST